MLAHLRPAAPRICRSYDLGCRAQSELLLQHHLAVGVFEALQLRQEGQAEQVFRQRLVGEHHGIDVAHDPAAGVNLAAICAMKTPMPAMIAAVITMLRMTPRSLGN